MLPATPNAACSPISIRFPFAENDDPPIILPQPSAQGGSKSHHRSRTAVELPPLFTRTSSTSPNRSSTFLPFLRHNRDRSISPDRVSPKEAAEFTVATPTGEGSLRQKSGKVEKLTSWFDGASEPVKISLVPSSSKEQLGPVPNLGSMERVFSASSESVDNLTKRPQRPTAPSHQSSQSVGRFSFFRKPSQPPARPDPLASDELANLDVHASLFPSTHIDEFSPAAFKNLQMNAEGTVRRLQNAYRENLQALKSAMSQKNIQADELDAAQTRNEHLKLQLTEMAERAVEQEKTIQALRTELEAARTVRMVSPDQHESPRRPNHRRNRASDISTLNESESGSDISSTMSIFSDAQSAGESMSSPGTSVAASPVLKSAVVFRPLISPVSEQGSLVKKYEPVQVLECQKCHGVKPSEAWDVIGVMKAESVALKGRIEELEGAQTDCLDFLSGIGVAC